MMPKQQEIEIPLLAALVTLGGKAKSQDVYPAVTNLLPQLTPADLAEQRPSGGGSKLINRIQCVRQRLI